MAMLTAVGGSCRIEIKPVSADSRGDSGGTQHRGWKAIPTPEGRSWGQKAQVVRKLDEVAVAPWISGYSQAILNIVTFANLQQSRAQIELVGRARLRGFWST